MVPRLSREGPSEMRNGAAMPQVVECAFSECSSAAKPGFAMTLKRESSSGHRACEIESSDLLLFAPSQMCLACDNPICSLSIWFTPLAPMKHSEIALVLLCLSQYIPLRAWLTSSCNETPSKGKVRHVGKDLRFTFGRSQAQCLRSMT